MCDVTGGWNFRNISISNPSLNAQSTYIGRVIDGINNKYSNPNKGLFTIECLKQNCQATVDIFNMAGKLIYTNTLQSQGKLPVDGSQWLAGQYIVRITDKQSKAILVKQIINIK